MADSEIRSTGLSEIEAPATQTSAAAAADLEGLSDKPKSFGKLAWERFLNHRLALVGAVGLIIIIALFFLAPQFSDYGVSDRNVRDRLLGPSWDHPFGTDEIGRDLFVRTAAGGRYSLQIGAMAAIISTLFGTILGAISGYFGGWVDVIVSQLVNLLLIVPALIILSVFALRYGGTAFSLALVLAALLWTRITRVVRGVVLSIKEQEYIMAAKAAGASHFRIIFRHLLPNVMGAIAVEVTLLLGTVIVLESTLSFLGLGVKPPNTSLGTLVRDAKGSIDSDPLRVLMPGIWIVLIVLCVNFLGDGLRDALDPRSKVDGNKPAKKAKRSSASRVAASGNNAPE